MSPALDENWESWRRGVILPTMNIRLRAPLIEEIVSIFHCLHRDAELPAEQLEGENVDAGIETRCVVFGVEFT